MNPFEPGGRTGADDQGNAALPGIWGARRSKAWANWNWCSDRLSWGVARFTRLRWSRVRSTLSVSSDPPRTVAELLDTLRDQGLVRSVAKLRELFGAADPIG